MYIFKLGYISTLTLFCLYFIISKLIYDKFGIISGCFQGGVITAYTIICDTIKKNRYVALFIVLRTREIHLELLIGDLMSLASDNAELNLLIHLKQLKLDVHPYRADCEFSTS